MNFLFQCLFKGLSQKRTILTGSASLCQKPGSTEAELQPLCQTLNWPSLAPQRPRPHCGALGKQAHR